MIKVYLNEFFISYTFYGLDIFISFGKYSI